MNWIDNWNYGILVNLGYYTIFILASRLALGKGSMLFFIRFLLYSVYTVTWIPITLQGIIRKNNKEWNHTKHIRNVEISEND